MDLKFFLPFWPADGVVDYDFIQDQKLSDEKKRIWHVFDEPPIDGALISRANIDDTKWLKKEIKEKGIHETLDYHQGPVICDCGAFDYVDQEEPTYDPEETLEFYEEYGFDLGVTVDHLVVKSINPEDADESIELTEEDKEERIQITIDNAKKMMDLKESDEKYSDITLIGAVQGYDADSYRRCAEELIDYGFDYIALGGLVRSNSDDIAEIVREVGSMIKEKEEENERNIKVHGFGIARDDLFNLMERNNFTSFDSATYLRRAWLSKKNNYHLNGEAYSAVRIRYNNPYSNDTTEEEKEILQKFENYAEGESDLDANDLIKILKEHEEDLKDEGKIKKTTFENLANAEEEYRRTLEEKPWEDCECPVCENQGIHVCIFRGNERNMRRGFHNVYNFYKNLSGSDQKSLESY